ncbi:hypothetical protein WICPIJ_003936, partial [Wickerhamomyces pijperi]
FEGQMARWSPVEYLRFESDKSNSAWTQCLVSELNNSLLAVIGAR